MKKLLVALFTVLVATNAAATNEFVIGLGSVRHYDELETLQGAESFDVPLYVKDLVNTPHGRDLFSITLVVDYNPNVVVCTGFVQESGISNYGPEYVQSPQIVAACTGTGGTSAVLVSIYPYLTLPYNQLVDIGHFTFNTISADEPTGGTVTAVKVHCGRPVGLPASSFELYTPTYKEYGWGLEGSVILNSCVRLYDVNGQAPACPQGVDFDNCGKCPPDLSEKVGRPARAPHREGWTDVDNSPWTTIKNLYR